MNLLMTRLNETAYNIEEESLQESPAEISDVITNESPKESPAEISDAITDESSEIANENQDKINNEVAFDISDESPKRIPGEITDKGFKYLAESLKRLTSLQSINLKFRR